jgi:hypothetical protein
LIVRACHVIVLAALVMAGDPATPQPVEVSESQITGVRVHRTARGAEMVELLPLPARIRTQQGSHLQEKYQVVYSAAVGPLSEGDVLQVSAEFEATNDCGYDVALGSWLVITRERGRAVPEEGRGDSYIAHPAGFNITNGSFQLPGAGDRSFMHHGFVSRSAVYAVPRGMTGTRHVNFVAYAQSDKLDCKHGGGLKVEKGNGQMSIIHFLASREGGR